MRNYHFNWLIQPCSSDAEPGSLSRSRLTYRSHKIRIAAVFSVSLLAAASISLPAVTSASVFGDLWNMLTGSSERTFAAHYETENLQTMPLPKAAMNIDPNPSKGGGAIQIVDDTALLPEEGPIGTLVEIEEYAAHNHQISVYVVREGDTLSDIAELFGVSVNTVIWGNDLKNATIQPGQTLAILPVTGIQYTVKRGGTLRDIIELHGGDLAEAALYNGVGPDEELAAGTEVVIPDGEYAVPAATPSAPRVARAAVGTSGPNYEGYYLRPIVGGRKSQGLHGYNAVDLAAPIGTPIMASASGEVIIVRSSGWNGGYGKYIVIRHDNGTQTLYAHNSSNIVSPGQWVVQGQVIGYIGLTGRSTGPHVHFEIRGAKNPF